MRLGSQRSGLGRGAKRTGVEWSPCGDGEDRKRKVERYYAGKDRPFPVTVDDNLPRGAIHGGAVQGKNAR